MAYADDVWRVTGTPDLTGASWDVESDANEMTLIDGIYYWEKTLTPTSETTYEFKVTKNGGWDGAKPSSNYSWTLPAGSYSAVIAFNGTDNPYAIGCVTIKGSFDSWGDGLTLTRSSGLTYTGVLDLSDKNSNVELKLLTDNRTSEGSNWFGKELTLAGGLLSLDTGDNPNVILAHSTSGYKTYDVTATYNLSTGKWTLTIAGKASRITSSALAWGAEGSLTLSKDPSSFTYTGTLDLSETSSNQTFKLNINSTLLGQDQISVVAPDGWITAGANEGDAITLNHATTNYLTYNITATWSPSTNATAGWTVTIAGGTERDAVIDNIKIAGAFNEWDWTTSPISLGLVGENVYRGVISCTADADFGFKVNDTWMGYDEVGAGNIDAPTGWVTKNDVRFKLNHSTVPTHYLTYTVTATWTPNPSAISGWVIKIEGKDAEPKNVYTVTFVNGKNWEEVAAYVWNGEEPSVEEIEGAWPGLELAKTGTATFNGDEYDVYTYSYETYDSAPEKIIFNNNKAEDAGDKEQTADLTFTDGKQYNDAVTFIPVYAVVGGNNGNETDEAYKAFFSNTWHAATQTDILTKVSEGVYSKTYSDLTLDKQTISYKIIKKDYLEATSAKNWYDNSTGANLTIAIPVKGIYNITFTFTEDGEVVTGVATKTAETITITDTGEAGGVDWATTVTNSALDFSGVTEFKAYTATVSDNTVTLNEVETDVQAETGLVLRGTAGSYDIPVAVSSSTATGDLKGSSTLPFVIEEGFANNYYALRVSGGYAQFALIQKPKSPATFTIPAGKAFLDIAPTSARELNIVFGDETTGIRSIDNGQLNNVYDLQGRKVAQPTKGLYIVNGKKVVKK